jgi:hypothetical protein
VCHVFTDTSIAFFNHVNSFSQKCWYLQTYFLRFDGVLVQCSDIWDIIQQFCGWTQFAFFTGRPLHKITTKAM